MNNGRFKCRCGAVLDYGVDHLCIAYPEKLLDHIRELEAENVKIMIALKKACIELTENGICYDETMQVSSDGWLRWLMNSEEEGEYIIRRLQCTNMN